MRSMTKGRSIQRHPNILPPQFARSLVGEACKLVLAKLRLIYCKFYYIFKNVREVFSEVSIDGTMFLSERLIEVQSC